MNIYQVERIQKNTSLLIVGNGFDCSLKAKTKYEEFYDFLAKCFNSNSLNSFLKLAGKNYKREDLVTFYELLSTQKETNYFINYFILYNKAFNCWVDFESELERIIVSLDDLLTVLKDADKTQYANSTIFIKIHDNPNLQSVIFNYPDNRFFQSEFRTKDYFVFKIKGAIIKGRKSMYKEVEDFIKQFPRELYKDLSCFSRLFSLYLKTIKDNVDYKTKHPFINECGVAINYNYTDFLEHYFVRKDSTLYEILYINGKCDWKSNDDRIVFGIDSNVLIKNKEFFVFTKTAQRSAKRTDIDRIEGFMNSYNIRRIVVFGHSLSTADKNSLRFIFNNCKGNSGNQAKIEIYCYNEDAKLSIISNLKEILDLDQYERLQMSGALELKDV